MSYTERNSLPLWRRLIIIFISIFLFILEIALVVAYFSVFMNYEMELYKTITGIILLISEIIGLCYVIYIIHKPISTNYKLTWSILIMMAPIVFCMLYTLNSTSRVIPKRKRKKLDKMLNKIYLQEDNISYSIDDEADKLTNILLKDTYAPIYQNTNTKFFNNIKYKHLDMLDKIKKASKYVMLEYFIFNKGICFNTLVEAIEIASKNGCKIYIIYDDVGSKGFIYKSTFKKLKEINNVKITRYQPLGLNFNMLINYRDHRKICIIDGIYAYCGGDNIADEYIHEKERFGYWRDNCIRYHGDAVKTFIYMFFETWYLSTKEIISNEILIDDIEVENDGYIVPFGDGPNLNTNPAYDLFMLMFSTAKRTIYISTPYLIIDDALINLLCIKAKSGIDVRILTPGIPDKKPIHSITRSNYLLLLKSGVKIYEFSNGFNHAKNIIVDDKFAFVGTINLDYRSLFLHYECGSLLIYNSEIKEISKDFLLTLEESSEIKYEVWKKRKFFNKIISVILKLLSPFF